MPFGDCSDCVKWLERPRPKQTCGSRYGQNLTEESKVDELSAIELEQRPIYTTRRNWHLYITQQDVPTR
ncbi:hypothetical protein MY10362_002424 [Beauveria mimosiformis]